MCVCEIVKYNITIDNLLMYYKFSSQQIIVTTSDLQILFLKACNIKTKHGIADTEPFKLVLIFVDFNERNIILEDPAAEIGDLRRMTTIGFQKMGCKLMTVKDEKNITWSKSCYKAFGEVLDQVYLKWRFAVYMY